MYCFIATCHDLQVSFYHHPKLSFDCLQYFSIFILCVSVLCIHVCSYMHPEARGGYPVSCSHCAPCSLETCFLTGPAARMGSRKAPGICLSPLSSPGVKVMQKPAWAYTWEQGSKLSFLCLQNKHSCLLSHIPTVVKITFN